MNIQLVVVGGKRAGMEIPVEEAMFRIGRGGDCHFQPESKLVSRLHCLISVDDGSVAIEDCGSAMGTFVNGEKVHLRHELKQGDRIKIDTLELEVQLTADEDGKKKPKHKSRDDATSAFAGEWGGGASSRHWEDATAEDKWATTAAQDQQTKQCRIPRKPIKLDGFEMLMLGALPLLLILILSMIFPADSNGQFSFDKVWAFFRTTLNRPIWPWWLYAVMLAIPASMFGVVFAIRGLIQRGRRG